MALHAPFHYDFVGSFLRPAELKDARRDFEAGKISKEDLTKVEDRAITDLVKKLKELGYHCISDGEFRRATWHLDFMWGFDGVGHHKTECGLDFHGENALIDDTYLTGKLSVGHHPFVDHFKFVQQFADEKTVVKQTMPAPGQFYIQLTSQENKAKTQEIYPNEEDLIQDLAAGYRKVIKDLYDAGCRNVQFDDCTWGRFFSPDAYKLLGTDESGVQAIIEKLIRINNLAIEGKPDDLVINCHICRGNYHSTWRFKGGYDRVAKELFAKEKVNGFYLEFDDERSGTFEPLQYVSADKRIVLGLITSKRPDLEDKDAVIKRIHEAEKYIPLDRLNVSPQCGFASCEIGNKLTEEEQWAKLRLVKEIAQQVWGADC